MDIHSRLSQLNSLNLDLDEIDEHINKLINLKEDYETLMNKLSAVERVELNWGLVYLEYTLYYIWLKVNNTDPKNHKIQLEMKRIQEYHTKMTKAKEEYNQRTMKNTEKVNENEVIKKDDMISFDLKLKK